MQQLFTKLTKYLWTMQEKLTILLIYCQKVLIIKAFSFQLHCLFQIFIKNQSALKIRTFNQDFYIGIAVQLYKLY